MDVRYSYSAFVVIIPKESLELIACPAHGHIATNTQARPLMLAAPGVVS